MAHIHLIDDFNLIMTILFPNFTSLHLCNDLLSGVYIIYALSLFKAGGMFVRWGRKDCPGNNTELVYSGQYASNWLIFCCILKMT